MAVQYSRGNVLKSEKNASSLPQITQTKCTAYRSVRRSIDTCTMLDIELQAESHSWHSKINCRL